MSENEPSPFDFDADALTLPFWEAAKAGRFVLPKCQACGKFHFYPRALCPHCGGRDLAWTAARTTGRITACTTVHRPPSPVFSPNGGPYTLAVVECADGVCLLGRLYGEFDAVVNMPVHVGFEPAGNYPRIVFRPVSATPDGSKGL